MTLWRGGFWAARFTGRAVNRAHLTDMRDRTMDYFAAVRAFLNAADLGSFSKAAEKAAIKTSTVSRYITELEADLGIALFNRSTRGLVLTEGGRVFREHALLAMQHIDDARQHTASLNTSPQGLLRVTMPTAFGRKHIIRHLPEFMDRYPDIDVDVVMSDTVLNIIDAGIDLAIRIGVLPDSQLMARQLATHRRVVCASPRYTARHGVPATPDELAAHTALRFPLAPDDKWLLVKREEAASLPKERAKHSSPPTVLRQEVMVQLQGRLRADDTDAILALAIAGRGVALLPTWSIGAAFQDGTLVHLLPEWEAQATRAAPAIWAVYPPKKIVSSKVRAFVDFYAAKFDEDGYWEQ